MSADEFAVTITEHRDVDILTAQGTARQKRISYTVGKFGPFTLQLDPRNYSEQIVADLIAKQVAIVRRLSGLTF